MSYHIQVDIETLATTNNAAVIAVGMCAFTLNDILESQLLLIDPRLAIGHRDPKTLAWWNEQDASIREHMFSGQLEPWQACDRMWGFINSYAKHLEGFWHFQSLGDAGCKVSLDLEYEFSSRLLKITVGPIFDHIANSLVDAFCQRARNKYGK